MESSLRSDISRIYGRIGNDFMNQNETQWDKLLKIKTTGRDDSRSDQYRYPYEPTQYCVLERLANNGLITKKNVLLDYGTGKGRVCFICLIRRDADLLVLSMMSEFLRVPKQTENMLYQAGKGFV
mgnify:FL=1